MFNVVDIETVPSNLVFIFCLTVLGLYKGTSDCNYFVNKLCPLKKFNNPIQSKDILPQFDEITANRIKIQYRKFYDNRMEAMSKENNIKVKMPPFPFKPLVTHYRTIPSSHIDSLRRKRKE